jgi:hypothetical protein
MLAPVAAPSRGVVAASPGAAIATEPSATTMQMDKDARMKMEDGVRA